MHRVASACRGPGKLGMALLCLSLGIPLPSMAQTLTDVEIRTHPASPGLGEPFRLEITFQTAEGWSPEAPDSLENLRGFQQTGRIDFAPADEGTGEGAWMVAYSLIPLRPGYRPLPSLGLLLTRRGDADRGPRSTMVAIPLGGVPIGSVLPPPTETIHPWPPLRPRGNEDSPPAPLPLTLTGCLLTGAGWLILRRKKEGPGDRWGESGEEAGEEEDLSLHDQLLEALRQDPVTPGGRIELFDWSVLLIRQILESRTPRNLVSCTTPELRHFLRNGSGLKNPEPLREALTLADLVRFRKAAPSEGELESFREMISTWLQDEDPRVGRKRRSHSDA